MFLVDECLMFIIIYLIICWLVNLKQKKNYPQRPILAYTIVGAEVLNFCVRDGNRCILFAIVTNLNIEK